MSDFPRRDPRASLPAPPNQRNWLMAAAALSLLAPAHAQEPPPIPAPPPPSDTPPPPPSAPSPAYPAPDPTAPPPPHDPYPAPAPYPSTAPYPAPAPYPSTAPYPAPAPYPGAPGPGVPPAQPYGAPPPVAGHHPPGVVEPPPPEPAWPSAPEPEVPRHRLTLQTESVFSADEGPFYNHLFGGRYAYGTTRATNLGVYAGYANLKGTGERVHSVLFMGQFEYQLFFGDLEQVIVPLRVGLGYLVQNGPMVRFATGVYFVVSDDLQAGMDLIAPSYWSASNDTVLSMNVSAEVSYVF